MTISITTARVDYVGNGITTAFPVPFPFFGEAELQVIERTIATGAETIKTLSTHYTVSGGNGATGTVTAGTAPADTVQWTIRRNTARTQATAYPSNSAFPSASHERALDRLTAQVQELEEKLSRALMVPASDAVPGELASSVDREGRIPVGDADGGFEFRAFPEYPENVPNVYWGGNAGGSANAITLTTTPAISEYGDGQSISFIASASNTGATTVNVNGLGAVTIYDANGAALGAGAIVNGQLTTIEGLISGGFRLKRSGTGRDIPFLDATSPGSPTYGLAYSATTTTAPAEYEPFFLRLDRDADTGAELTINGGTARQLRRETGGALSRSDVRASIVYPAQRIGTIIYLSGVNNIRSLTTRLEFLGTGFVDRKVPGDTSHRERVNLGASGVDLVAGGTGAAADAITALRAQADGDVRVYQRLLIGTPPYEAFTETNPPSIIDDVAAALTQIPMAIGRDNRDVVDVGSTLPYNVTEDYIRVSVSGAWLDFSTQQVNRACNVEIQAGASAVLYTGDGTNWRGTASQKLAASASKSYRVVRTQTQRYVQEGADFTTTSATATPTYSGKCAFVPAQSWGVQAEQDIWRGFQEEMTRLTLNRDMLVIQGVAVGASSLQEENDTAGTNNWYDHSAGANGPNLTAALTTLTTGLGASSPAYTGMFAWLGINDAKLTATNVGMDDTGNTTRATWQASMAAVQAAIRTATGIPGLPWFMLTLPNQPASTFYANSITALNLAILDCVATNPDTHRGPDSYDLWRYDDARHLTYVGERELGRRLARFYATIVHSATPYLGPKITGFSRVSAREHVVTILRGPGGTGGGTAFRRPTKPIGFGLLPAGTDIVSGADSTRYGIARYSWGTSGTNDTLTIYTSEDTEASCRLVYPDGFMSDARHRSRIIAGDDGFGYLPLLSHRTGDYTT